MNIIHLSYALLGSNKEISLRFHPGVNPFRKCFILETSSDEAKTLPQAISAILTGSPHNLLAESRVSLSDQAGDSWHLKRLGTSFVCIKNDLPQPYTEASSLLSKIWHDNQLDAQVQGKPFAVSHYHILPRDEELHAKPFVELDAEDDIKIKFLHGHIREICEAAEHTFASAALAKESVLTSVCEKLEPLYREYRELVKQYQHIYQEKKSAPCSFADEQAKLTEQLEIMRKIADFCHDLLQVNPSFNQLKEKHKEVEAQIAENLQSCQLTELPDLKESPDWDNPLQCLCYISVLEKLTPVLDDTVKQFNQHFQTATNIKSNEKSFDNLITSLTSHLKQALSQLSQYDAMTVKDDLPAGGSMSLTWYDKIKQKFSVAEEERGELAKNLLNLQLREVLSYTLDYIEKLNETPSSLAVSAKPLEEFQLAAGQKLDNLRQHWQKIRQQFQLPDCESMHDLLQFILHYNELIILGQKRQEIKDALQLKNKQIYELKNLIEIWYAKTGSQKHTPLSKHQIIISEAQNIVRYQKEKEQKLRQLNDHQISIEINNYLKAHIEQRAKTIHRLWNQVWTDAKLPVISAKDPRMAPLLEKYSLLKSLLVLQDNVLAGQTIALFTPDWYYSPVCTWSFLNQPLRKEQKKQFINKLQACPQASLHIFFVSDPELAHQAYQLGLGKITINQTTLSQPASAAAAYEQSHPRPREHVAASIAPQSSQGARTNTTGQRMLRPGQKSPPPLASQSVLSSKAQAVVDLLNGVKPR